STPVRPQKKIITSSALASLSAIAAHAQTVGDDGREDSAPIDEVVVTAQKQFFRPTDASSATKFDLAIFDPPQSISVVTADLIDSARPEGFPQGAQPVAGASGLGGWGGGGGRC